MLGNILHAKELIRRLKVSFFLQYWVLFSSLFRRMEYEDVHFVY
jgi:hypothetical protein